MLGWIRNQSKQLAGFSLAVFMLSMVSVFCQNCFASDNIDNSFVGNVDIKLVQSCHDSSATQTAQKFKQFKDCCASDTSGDDAALLFVFTSEIEVDKVVIENQKTDLKSFSTVKKITFGYTPHIMAHANFSSRNPVLLS